MLSIYRKCSQKVTDYFVNHKMISNDKKAVYEYGFEILISTLSYAFVFFLIALVTKTFWASLVFLVGFFIIRTIAGGYHANTYLKCHLISAINHILFVIFYHCIPLLWKNYVCFVVFLMSSVFIMIFAPVDHPNKPFIKSEKKRFRLICVLYSVSLILISGTRFFIIREKLLNFIFCYAIGTLSATISVVVAKINLKKGKNVL